jgi:hypothetical protein
MGAAGRSDFWIVTIFLDFAGRPKTSPVAAKPMQGMGITR